MKAQPEAKFLLQKILLRQEEKLSARYAWIWENARWHELVVALVSQVLKQSESDVRRMIGYAAELGLLEIDDAIISPERKSQFTQLLTEEGASQEEATRAVGLVIAAAQGFQRHFGGTVAAYLRYYGEQMLRDIDKQFSFPLAQSEAVQQGFIVWLQNTLGLPLSLRNPAMKRFCRDHQISESELVAAADEIGLNLAVLDDVIASHIADMDKAQKQSEA
jgi:hypothetical protein